jgi:hypothetical protein
VKGLAPPYYVKNALQNEVSRYKRELSADPSTARLPVIVSPYMIMAVVANDNKRTDTLLDVFKPSKYYGYYPSQTPGTPTRTPKKPTPKKKGKK